MRYTLQYQQLPAELIAAGFAILNKLVEGLVDVVVKFPFNIESTDWPTNCLTT